MEDEQGREEEGQPRKIRVVDKRVSSRREEEGRTEPAGESEVPSEPASDASSPEAPPEVAGESAPPPEEPATVTPLRPSPPAAPAEHPSGGATAPSEPPSQPPGPAGEVWTPEQEQEARRMADEMAQIPSLEWVINVSVTLANAAGTKLNAGSVDDAALAIDALAAIVEKVGPRLGDAETPLRQTLAQLQMGYAERAGNPQGPPP
jgi:hypothetical protein